MFEFDTKSLCNGCCHQNLNKVNHVGGYHLVPSVIQARDVTCSIIYSSSSFSGCSGCKYCLIRCVPLTVIKSLIIFMFAKFLMKKFFQSCSARTGFTLINDAFVALRVANNLLEQIFVCQAIASTSNKKILMSAINTTRLSHFWASQNSLFGSEGTELCEPNSYISVFFFESSI